MFRGGSETQIEFESTFKCKSGVAYKITLRNENDDDGDGDGDGNCDGDVL